MKLIITDDSGMEVACLDNAQSHVVLVNTIGGVSTDNVIRAWLLQELYPAWQAEQEESKPEPARPRLSLVKTSVDREPNS